MKSTLLPLLGLVVMSAPAFAGDPVPKKRTAKQVVFTRLFNEADSDGNQILDFEEYSNSYGASPRRVITEIRFNELASPIKVGSARGVVVPLIGVLLDDFIAANGGRAIKPSKAEVFWAADYDESGDLDISEFDATRVYPPSSFATVIKAFDRIDKDDDQAISPAEWGLKKEV